MNTICSEKNAKIHKLLNSILETECNFQNRFQVCFFRLYFHIISVSVAVHCLAVNCNSISSFLRTGDFQGQSIARGRSAAKPGSSPRPGVLPGTAKLIHAPSQWVTMIPHSPRHSTGVTAIVPMKQSSKTVFLHIISLIPVSCITYTRRC